MTYARGPVASSLLVVMALEIESQGLFAERGVEVLYTGIGKVNAAYRLGRKLAEHRAALDQLPRVVNFGTVGSPTLPAGSVVACRRFVQRDMDVSGLGFALGTTPFEDVPPLLEFPSLHPGLPEAICGTGDRFETGKPSVECDVIDMEAYALAKVCHLEGAQFSAVKFVTDGADGNAGVDWHANLPRAARAFVDHYTRLLQR
jgi:adenosylhomocysteine nucleosidase